MTSQTPQMQAVLELLEKLEKGNKCFRVGGLAHAFLGPAALKTRATYGGLIHRLRADGSRRSMAVATIVELPIGPRPMKL